jgi:recombination protein RecT
MTHVYAVAELTSGHKAFVVLTKGQVLKRKLSAQGTGSKASPWNQHEDEMWKKSAVRALTKYLPRSAEVSQAAAFDEAPEYGAKQTSFLSPEVRETLEDKGYDMEGDEVPDGEPS